LHSQGPPTPKQRTLEQSSTSAASQQAGAKEAGLFHYTTMPTQKKRRLPEPGGHR